MIFTATFLDTLLFELEFAIYLGVLLSLLFFNAGIEAGQLMVIPFFALVIYLLKSNKIKIEVNAFASYFIGGLGSYWLIERVLSI